MVRWNDGLVGGLAAGCVVALFYAIVSVAWLHETTLAGFFAGIASGVIHGDAHLEKNPWAVLCGTGLHFLAAAIFGMAYALPAAHLAFMRRAPYSVVCGLAYGLAVWFVLNDVLVPLLGVASSQPLWEGLLANMVFYGLVLSEYMTVAHRRSAATT
ncbi:MAG: hypothetical protein ABR591_07725 [Candidatus Velthaea sp.]